MVAPVIAAAGIGAVGNLIGGIAGGKGAKKAAKIQQENTRAVLAHQQGLYDRTAANFAPEIASGNRAGTRLDELLGLVGNDPAAISAMLQATPGYQFTMQQAMRGVNASAHAKGLGNSGAAMKALQDRAANIASTASTLISRRWAAWRIAAWLRRVRSQARRRLIRTVRRQRCRPERMRSQTPRSHRPLISSR